MHASTCWLEQAGFTMPSDFLGGKASEFTCGPTSYCLRDTLSTDPSILCMKCGLAYLLELLSSDWRLEQSLIRRVTCA